MLKKSLMALSIFMLVGCGSSNVYRSAEPIYKISDEHMKKVIFEQNNLEQCIYPQLKGLSYSEADRKVYSKKSEAEKITLSKFFQEGIIKIIGEQNFAKLSSDQSSQYYFSLQHSKFNNQNAKVNKAECSAFKKEYYPELKKVQNELRKAKEAELARQKQAEKERKAREAYLKTPAGQMELARIQQERQHQEMVALQRQQLAQQKAMQNQMEWQQFNQQLNQVNQQIQQINQSNMQMMQQMIPQRVIVTPAYQAPCFGTGPCWNNVY